jgi:outer membrane protein OmpA-like peptidoglycan-associated protein
MKSFLKPLILIFTFILSYQINAKQLFDNSKNIGDPIEIIRINNKLMLYCHSKITFSLSESKLNKPAIHELSKIASRLIHNSDLKIEISVHSDTRSDIDYAIKITQERADKIKEFLINYGIKEENLTAIGFGDTRILNKCQPFVECTDAEHNVNKRVELKILNPEALKNYKVIFPKK